MQHIIGSFPINFKVSLFGVALIPHDEKNRTPDFILIKIKFDYANQTHVSSVSHPFDLITSLNPTLLTLFVKHLKQLAKEEGH